MELAHERHGRRGDPSLVLVHGITERGDSWRPLVAPLTEHYDVLVVDLRGHGASPTGDSYDPLTLAADVHDTVVSATSSGFDGAAPLVVGHSLGGIVAAAYGAAFSTRAVIDVDQPLRLASFKDTLGQLEPLLRGTREQFDTAIALVFSMMMGPLPTPEAERISALRRADPAVVLGIWGTVFDSTPEELDAQVQALAAGIRVPLLSLHGIDPGEGYAEWLTGLVPTATVESWPEHGHYPHLVDPARFLARVASFDPAR
jgi:pimeloyl-ACP methyl ester carboxylesterase